MALMAAWVHTVATQETAGLPSPEETRGRAGMARTESTRPPWMEATADQVEAEDVEVTAAGVAGVAEAVEAAREATQLPPEVPVRLSLDSPELAGSVGSGERAGAESHRLPEGQGNREGRVGKVQPPAELPARQEQLGAQAIAGPMVRTGETGRTATLASPACDLDPMSGLCESRVV